MRFFIFTEARAKISLFCVFSLRFHTYDYARHFVSACTRILGLEGTPEGVEDQGRLTRVAAVRETLVNSIQKIVFLFGFSFPVSSP